MKYFLFLLALLISDACFLKPGKANNQQNLSQGDQTAQTFLNQMNRHKANAGAHPFYQGVPQESHYHETELKGRAQTAAANNPASQMVFESSDERPQMKIDPQRDPLLTGANKVLENPLQVIGGQGTQVVEVQQGGGEQTISCEEPGEDSLETCTRELTVKVIKKIIEKKWNGIFQYSKCCNTDRKRSRHPPPCMALRGAVIAAKQTLRGPRYRRGIPQPRPIANLDITQAYKACMAEMEQHRRRGCSCDARLPVLPFPKERIKKVLLVRNPHRPSTVHMAHNYLHQYNSGRIEYDYQYYVEVLYEEEAYKVLPDEWSDNCARLESRVDQGLCGYHAKTCTQGPSTRVIEGIPITRDCWKYAMTYACSFSSKDDCGPLRAKGCAQINSQCKQRIGNACVVYQQTYQCKDSPRTTFQIAGGDTPFCMDGNCRDQSWENNDEMMSSVAQLSILKEMQDNFKNGFLFKGEDNRCSKYVLSFKDCCGSAKGWGTDMGLASCSANEKLLNKRRKAGLCHRIGTYCAKKVLGKCVKKKTSYCCFSSKLLKAFQEQGRAQIRMGWGSPKHPLCRGFTIEEIQRIDFSKLDLREVFEELMKNFKPGKMGDVGRQVGERLETIKRGMVPNAKMPQPKQRNEG